MCGPFFTAALVIYKRHSNHSHLPASPLHTSCSLLVVLGGRTSTSGDTGDITSFGQLSPWWCGLFDNAVAQATHVPADNSNKFVPITKLDWKEIFFSLEWLSVSGVSRNRLPQKSHLGLGFCYGGERQGKSCLRRTSLEPCCDACSQSDIHPPASDSSPFLSTTEAFCNEESEVKHQRELYSQSFVSRWPPGSCEALSWLFCI